MNAPRSHAIALVALTLIGTNACGSDSSETRPGRADTVDADDPETGPADTALDTAEDSAPLPDLGPAPDTGPPPFALCEVEAGFGCACVGNDDCNSGLCIEGPDGLMCSRTCVEECPAGFDCVNPGGQDPQSICVPRHVSLCRPCEARSDCRIGTDTTAWCVPHADPDEGRFCATSCASLPCPDGYACEELPVDGGTTARLCVPEDDALCGCRPAWADLSLTTTCARSNETGSCGGSRTCGPDGLTACDARLAVPETCNGRDDDCDGLTDNIPPEPCPISTSGIETTCPGVTVCSGGALVCDGRAPSAEICDGIDNNCDGTTDDSVSNCAPSGCALIGASYVDSGPPSCFEGQCAYEDPVSCGYYTCVDGATGAGCATSCTDDSRCIANATCASGTCRCRTGYAGATCENCADGYQDNDGDGVCRVSCDLLPCVAPGGSCDDTTGVAICTCETGYIDAACDACDQPNYTDPEGDGICNRRGEVSLGPPPSPIARVGKTWRYTLIASQQGFMPGDAFVFSLQEGPPTMTINTTTGAIAWTPSLSEQTWHEDPLQSGSWPITLRATAPDGQFAEHSIELEVFPPIILEGLHPAAGLAAGGETILVFGSGFVGPPEAIGVTFGDVPAANVSILDPYTLSVTTPSTFAAQRRLIVTLDGTPDADLRPGFTHLPTLEALFSSSLPLESNLRLTARGTHPSSRSRNVLALPGRGRTERRITATSEPDGLESPFALGVSNDDSTLATGAVHLYVNDLRSNALPLRISDSPLPARLAVTGPTTAATPGQSFTLTGAGFAGLSPADLQIRFSGTSSPATVTAIHATGTSVTVTVPSDARTGPLSLEAPGRLPATSSLAITVAGSEPVVSSVYTTPEIGPAGSALVIVGTGFVDAAPAAHTVRFNETQARVISAEPTRLVVEVPPGADFGANRVTLTVGETTVDAAVFGVTRPTRVIAGGGPSTWPSAASGMTPTEVPVSETIGFSPDGLMFLVASGRLFAVNQSATPITAYGHTFEPGLMQQLSTDSAAAIAVHPLNQDLYYSTSTRILRVRRSDGIASLYAGALTSGYSGDLGFRLNATFNNISNLDFTSEGILAIADNGNGVVRAINTSSAPITLWGITMAPDNVYTVDIASTSNPLGVAVDAGDNLYFSNFTNIRKVRWDRLPESHPDHVRSEVIIGAASGPTTGCPATGVQLRFANRGVAVDKATGDLFIGGRGGIIRRIIASGSPEDGVNGSDCVELFAGRWDAGATVPTAGYGGDGGAPLETAIPLNVRAYVDPDGDVVLTGSGIVQRVTRGPDGRGTAMSTIAGRPPFAIDGEPLPGGVSIANLLPTLDGARGLIYGVSGTRIISIDEAAGTMTTLAGTGVTGNSPDGPALSADLASVMGLAMLGQDRLVFIETLLPRVGMIDLNTGHLSRLAGDGQPATAAEQNVTGPALDGRVSINTGNPEVVVNADGLVIFSSDSVIRVLNPTDAPLSAYGVTVPAGYMSRLPQTAGPNLGGLLIDETGDLWVTSLNDNSVSRIAASPPHAVESLIERATGRHGHPPPGRVADLELSRPSGVARSANGDLFIANGYLNSVWHVRAHPDGSIDGDCLAAPILESSGVRKLSFDGENNRLLLVLGSRLRELLLP